MSKFSFVLMSNEEKIYEDDVEEVRVVTDAGSVSILAHHQPYITQIKESVDIKKEGRDIESIKIEKGFLYTNGEKCFAIAD